jgi:hypothetical protein
MALLLWLEQRIRREHHLAAASSRRTTLTVLNPSDFAITIVARPVPEFARFWMTGL